jgi:thioredoxin-like negative regulator of GroEL
MSTIPAANWRSKVVSLSSLASERPLVVLFTSSDQGSVSQELAGAFDRFSGEYSGRLDFVVLDLAKDEDWARSLHVQFAPAWLVIRNGQIVYQVLGLLPASEMSSMFDSVLRAQFPATADPQAVSQEPRICRLAPALIENQADQTKA